MCSVVPATDFVYAVRAAPSARALMDDRLFQVGRYPGGAQAGMRRRLAMMSAVSLM